MGLSDRALGALRQLIGDTRDKRDQAESPSADALRFSPTSAYAIWGREDIGGLLSVSQNLMDRYADYEAMKDYPDIACFAGDMRVYVVDENSGVVSPLPIESLARNDENRTILAFDRKSQRIVRVAAERPRLSGRGASILKIKLSNGSCLRVTPEHKILTTSGYVEARDLKAGALLVGPRAGFELDKKSLLTVNSPGVVTIVEPPVDDGLENVYDVTTSTHNLVVNGVVCHNSAFHYFASDATQPNLDNGRVVWIQSRDEAIVSAADALIKKRLRLENDLFSMAYTLCQYGNLFEELLLTNDGVVGLNSLAVPTMRRIEKHNGSLIGFAQDVTGRFTANQEELRRMLASSTELPRHLALFEDWQVAHFRLRSTSRRSPTGVSVAESARWIWKRLVMLEDSVMMYRLCLRGDSKVWTPTGYRYIKDVNEGDEVYCFTTDDTLKKTRVTYKKHNGKDTIFRVKSRHRDLYANATHPVLVEEIVNQGSGRPRLRVVKYVEIRNLIPGVHSFMTPAVPSDGGDEIVLRRPALDNKAKLREPALVTRRQSYPEISKECGVHHYRARDFFAGKRALPADTAHRVLEFNGYSSPTALLEESENWGGRFGRTVTGLSVPETADEDFARWFGFMIGDGFITTRRHKNGYTAQNEVGFALGADAETNAKYRAIFERYVGNTLVLRNDQGQRLGAYSVVSSRFAQFMLLNGFIPGAHNKRVPEWVFRARPSIKLAFLRGLADADAHIKPEHISKIKKRKRAERATLEMCNKALLEDVQTLCQQVGIVVTRVSERVRPGGRNIPGSSKLLPECTSYMLAYSFKPATPTEKICSVEEIGTDDIYDIGVEADEHNFVADGVVVHNTRAPSRFAFYVDVTDVPSNRVESFLRKAKRDLKKKKMINPNSNMMDMRYNPLCLSGDTKIPLLDGRTMSIVDMVGAFERGEQQWVYSVDVKDRNKLVPGKVVWAGGTRKNAQLIKITLDNGESIKVTPDHKMIRRSGEFAEAQTLKVNDSLMPFRSRVSDKASGDSLHGYRLVYCPERKEYVYVHRVVAEQLLGKTKGDGCVTHHRDFDPLNNDPTNLQVMLWEKHLELHRLLGHHHPIQEQLAADPDAARRQREAASRTITAYNQTDKARAETAATNREHNKAARMREAITPEIRKKQKCAARKSKRAFWKDKKRASQSSEKMRYVYPGVFIDAIRQIIDEQGPRVGAPTIARIANERGLLELLIEANPDKVGKLKNIHRDMIRSMCHSLGFKNLKEFKAAEPIPHNHKVVKIEWLEEREDTYTLSVDTAHTFAVSAGVFVKNSSDEDFFLAVREGRDLSRVELLQGPTYSSVEDIDYFRKKLHGALMVPSSYLGQESQIPGRALLSTEDSRAARVTLQVQNELKFGIEQIIRTDFAARQFANPWDLDFEVMMTVPSNIYELAALEVKNARADFAARIHPDTSRRWVLTNVFKLSDAEIDLIDEQRKKEAEASDALGMDPSFGAFTGGRPPKADESGMLPPDQLPPDALPPQSGSPQLAWRVYDASRRLEERREKESKKNHQQLLDRLEELKEADAVFARKLSETQAFMREFKNAAIRNIGDKMVVAPSARPRKTARIG